MPGIPAGNSQTYDRAEAGAIDTKSYGSVPMLQRTLVLASMSGELLFPGG